MKKVGSVLIALMLLLNVSLGYTLTVKYARETTVRDVEENQKVIVGLSSRGKADYTVDTNNVILRLFGNRREFVMPAEEVEITIEAQAGEDTMYLVTFETDGGSEETSITVTYGGTYGELPVPTKDGYNFIGWYSDDSYTTQITNTTIVEAQSNHILYAKWEEDIIRYTVAFDANNGEGNMEAQEFIVGIAQNLTNNSFTREGYIFDGWNTIADGSGTSYIEGQNVLNLTEIANGIVTLYAQWYIPFELQAKVGDYVTYTPTATTVDLTTITGVSQTAFNPSETTAWRVLSNDGTTVELVSADSVGNLTLGSSSDAEISKANYAQAVKILKEISEAYVDKNVATGGRGLGSKEGSSTEEIDTTQYPLTWANTYKNGNNGLPYRDAYYSDDLNTINNNSMKHSTGFVWLASRGWGGDSVSAGFFVRTVDTNGFTDWFLIDAQSDGRVVTASFSFGVRPVVSLASGLEIDGEGTEGSPWKIN